MRQRPWIGLSLMLEDAFRIASLPLFADGRVEVLEWSFDTAWGAPAVPDWADALLNLYSDERRLFGHGVHFSPLSAHWERRQELWLERLHHECQRRQYVHVSEHFGFMTAEGFCRGAPLPVPYTEAAVAIGRERIGRMARVAGTPVGLENLALALGRPDVEHQGAFIGELIAPVDGFVVLDVHNLFCQLSNFPIGFGPLLATYPLHRVVELHISGGSWSSPRGTSTPFRRDTHDAQVPDDVFALLPAVLDQCPNVQAIFMERLGATMPNEVEREQFRADFRRLSAVVEAWAHGS